MRINSSVVGMDSSRSYQAAKGQRLSFLSISSKKTEGVKQDGGKTRTNGQKERSMEEMLSQLRGQRNTVTKAGPAGTRDELEKANRIRQQCVRYLLELFFRADQKDAPRQEGDAPEQTGMEENSLQQLGDQAQNDVVTTQYRYRMQMSYSESENTAFSTTGKVVTADGRELPFHLEMQMSRSFQAYYEENYTVTRTSVCDPLVINLDGDIAQVEDRKFLFDLDADGETDQISMLGRGSGFLALDQNGDGRINDGSELFGTKSGNGFADLAIYDEDGNGWIDENDAVFSKLKIWGRDENGSDVLYRLKDKGVGAICLQNASTEFSLNDGRDNNANAYIRKTGIFLYENGSAGTVQHVDMVK